MTGKRKASQVEGDKLHDEAEKRSKLGVEPAGKFTVDDLATKIDEVDIQDKTWGITAW